jgi:hypothetical protein
MADPYGDGGGGGRAMKQPQQRQARLKPALEMEDLLQVFTLPPSSSHAMVRS